ncbi:sugar ABC transporter ATP-binding protein [Streptomyces sp. NPDC056716]|uniref:sugar ABC transporter ATP-binding protein n=1 Tax=unclassified Streptomyces TaxID=2593676 RepID=UPI0036C9F202
MDHRTATAVPGVPLLELENIGKSYPGVRALNGVTVAVRAGEIHVLVGENGAGKSTLLKVMSGQVLPDEGTIRVDGRPVVLHSPAEAHHHGIAMVNQELSLVPQVSAVRNVMLGRERARWGVVNRADRERRAREVLEWLGFHGDPAAPVGTLGVAQQQIVELARALSVRARLIIFDEPTATLSEPETRRLFEIMKTLRAEGHALVFVSHRMPEVFELGDRMTVLRDGREVRTMAMAADLTEADVVRMMVGRELDGAAGAPTAPIGPELLRVEGLSRTGVFEDVSFTVAAGEIVGLAGMVGAGRTEVARSIVGADPLDGGTISVRGRPLPLPTPRKAIEAGIAFLPEDRKEQGLALAMSIASNVSLPGPPGRFGALSRAGQRALAEKQAARVALAGSVLRPAGTLSGGNQQKVVLARWLTTSADIYLFDEPTRGIDVAAKSEIYRLMDELVANGAGILMISSELPEVIRMSTRVLVMRKGSIVAELTRDEATEEAIVAAASLDLESTS